MHESGAQIMVTVDMGVMIVHMVLIMGAPVMMVMVVTQ